LTSLTVIIPALDEELHIRRCVESALRLGPVLVVDGGSSDETRSIAERAGARVVDHPWEGYVAQKNWAIETLASASSWVLFLDADEWVTSELAAEIQEAICSEALAGYYLPRKNIFLGRLLKHAWWYPDYQLRLFRADRGRYEERLVHEHVLIDGKEGFLQHALMHENLKGIDAFMERHVRYARLEALEILRYQRGELSDQRRGRFLGSWPERRRALKLKVWYRLPGRPAIRFLWMFLVKRGFLDGKEGRIYCQLIAMYDAMINAKLAELELGERRRSGCQR
jgi:glycosyltransferase involved in cell wall biosynthesis